MPAEFLNILLLAMIAAFVAFRLYTVLGRRTGHERSPDDQVRVPDARTKEAPVEDNVVKMPERSGAPTGLPAPLARALMDIKLADRRFDENVFMDGARAAYEMIVTAFANGDRETLRPLLGDEVLAAFQSAIGEREKRGERLEFTFLGFEAAKIAAAELKERRAEITVSFESDVAEKTFDQAGKPVHGESEAPRRVNDIWTFARDVNARDPNWTLVATASG